MVPADGIPWNHEVRMAVDELVIGHPERVGDTLYTLEMVYIPGRHDKFYVNGLRHESHSLCYGLLVIVAVASKVVGQIEIQRFLESLPFGGIVRTGRGHSGCAARDDSHGNGEKWYEISFLHFPVFIGVDSLLRAAGSEIALHGR